MCDNVLRYFAGGNTAKGFYSLYDSNIKGLGRVLLLTGRSQLEKKEMIERLFQKWKDTDYKIEALQHPEDPYRLEGFIIRELGFAILDGDKPRKIGETFVGPEWETIDLDQIDNHSQLEANIDRIKELRDNIAEHYDATYKAYKTALQIHDEWEKIYISQMDFQKADQVADTLISQLFPKKSAMNRREARIVKRFLGAATPLGAVDFVDNITQGLKVRYFLKGRAGTGKSTLLKKIVQEAKNSGYDTEVYQCGFDPGSLDMVLIRELGWAIFDSTAPHEYFPEREGDEIIDMYELTVAPGTDEKYAKEIQEVEGRYREQMQKGRYHLAEVKRNRDELDQLYAQSRNEEHLDVMFQEIEKFMNDYLDIS